MFTPHYPDEERAEARPLKRTPCYDRMKAMGAVFGSVYGWERPGWFAPLGYALTPEQLNAPKDVLLNHNHAPPDGDGRIKEKWSFRRSNYFEHVGNECRNVFDNVGLLDMSAFAKYEVSGPKAEEWLDSILANRIPKKVGRLGLCHLLTKNGGVRSEFTVYRTGAERFYLVGAGAFERHDFDTLVKLLPASGGVQLQKITTQMGVLVLAGPRSRELLQKLTDSDLSNAAFPWLRGSSSTSASPRRMRCGSTSSANSASSSTIRSKCRTPSSISSWKRGVDGHQARSASRPWIRCGSRKSYRLIPRELSIEYAALESGLDRFVHLNKGQFIGRDGLVGWQQRGFQNRFVTMEVHGIKDARCPRQRAHL